MIAGPNSSTFQPAEHDQPDQEYGGQCRKCYHHPPATSAPIPRKRITELNDSLTVGSLGTHTARSSWRAA
jgi:hypothetical protein